MKIINAYVSDPRTEGKFDNPILCIEVDESLHITNRYDELDYSITVFGPYVAVDEMNQKTGGWEPAEIGRFNTTNCHREKLVDVHVIMPQEVIDVSMGIDRTRRLIRKWADGWELVLDDLAAQRGEITWRLRQSPLVCIECSRRAEAETFYNHTYLALCPEHMRSHGQYIRDLRIASLNS